MRRASALAKKQRDKFLKNIRGFSDGFVHIFTYLRINIDFRFV